MRAELAGRLGRAALVLAAAAASLPALAFDMPELMGLLSRNVGGEARFVEQRFVEGMEAPLTSSGTLSFTAPDRFTRETLKPRHESLSVQGNQVVLKRGSRSRSTTLDSVPEAGAIVEAVRGTLGGNGAALQRHFQTTLSGEAARWELQLVPRDERLAGQVSQVRIGGQRNEVRQVEVRLADGDRSVMTIEPVSLTTAEPGAASRAASSR